MQHLYLNQILPLSLSRQGKMVFHASTVEIGGEAVAFLGESGSGKSTLAASFVASGHRFLTDDGLVVEERGGMFVAQPGHPSIRLWRDSQQALMQEGQPVAPPVQYTSKVRILARNGVSFCRRPLALRRLYFLAEEGVGRPAARKIKPGEAVARLLKHSFLLDIEERRLIAGHFDQLSAMMRQLTCWRLDFPHRFDVLPEVRRMVIAGVAGKEGVLDLIGPGADIR